MLVDKHNPYIRGKGQICRRAVWLWNEASEKVRQVRATIISKDGVLVRVPIAGKRHHGQGSSYKGQYFTGAGLRFRV